MDLEGKIIKIGCTIQVIKGRKVPINTIAKVLDIRPIYDIYHRQVATQLICSHNIKTYAKNVVVVTIVEE